MKIFKQIIGYGLLFGFIGGMAGKFHRSIAHVPGSEFIVLFAVLIILILLLGIKRILED